MTKPNSLERLMIKIDFIFNAYDSESLFNVLVMLEIFNINSRRIQSIKSF